MTQDEEIYRAIKYNEVKRYWFYIVPTSVRRSGLYKISDKKYNLLKKKYGDINNPSL